MSLPADLPPVNPELDLVLERIVPVPAERVWRAWTTPSHLKQWFCPKPWETVHCEIDLRPGGIFRTVMRGPDGEEMDGGAGCYLEVVPFSRLTWTDAMGPGYRPNAAPFMTATLLLEEVDGGTRYTAIARHVDAENQQKHAAMGFFEGWGAVVDQLVAQIQADMAAEAG